MAEWWFVCNLRFFVSWVEINSLFAKKLAELLLRGGFFLRGLGVSGAGNTVCDGAILADSNACSLTGRG